MIDKLLHVCLLAPGSPQWGLRNALKSISGEYQECPWYDAWMSGRLMEFRNRLIGQAKSFNPDAIFFQLQTDGIVTPAMLQQLPGMKCEWNGDCRDVTPAHHFTRAPHLDCMMFSNMRDVTNVRAKGFNAEFLNIGFSPDPFSPEGPVIQEAEILFLGNNYSGRFPCSHQRMKMVAMLRERYGARFKVRGNGWGLTESWVDEPTEASMYRGCKISIDNNHYQNVDRFTSDRRFRAMASGAFVLCNWHPGIEIDFELGKHLVTWKTIEEISPLIDYYLAHEDERNAIAKAGCAHVYANHSWDARVAQLQEIIAKYAKVAA